MDRNDPRIRLPIQRGESVKRAFPWLLSTFSLGFALVLAAQLVFFIVGVRVALSEYEDTQKSELEKIARDILINPGEEVDRSLQYSNPIFVFSSDRNLVYSNRGKRKAIPTDDLIPVHYDDTRIGYYYAGEMRFIDNEANRVFLSTLRVLIVGSIAAFIIISVVVTIFASRRIAEPVKLLQSDIRSIESQSKVKTRDFSIAELSEISRALGKLSSILSEEEEYKRRWMQDIAHDLRTPISGLKGQIEGMRDGVLEPNAERFEKNLLEIDRLQALVQGISDLYAVENAQDLRIESFATEEFIRDLLIPYETEKLKREISIKKAINSEIVVGDRALLLRAVGNLVSNALTYTPIGGSVCITVRKADRRYEIVVSDNGPGIPSEHIDRIFQRFFRGDYGRHSTGTGLGLSITRAIVARHGGTISVSNRESAGTGTTGAVFTISIPAVKD